MSDLFYSGLDHVAGNDMLWWRRNNNGYTTNLIDVYTKEQAIKMYEERRTDVQWPKDYIDARILPAVDIRTVQFQRSS